MEITSAASYGQNVATAATATEKAATTTSDKPVENTTVEAKASEAIKPAAIYEPSEKSSDKKVDINLVNKLLKESKEKTDSFKKMLEGLLNKQAEKNAIANGQTKNQAYGDLVGKINSGEDAMVEIDEATQAKAKEDISEDGYYGVKQTSERILGFAKAISGGDSSKIDTLRKAVEDGFKAAEEMWGGELPQISKDTYDTVMKGFDDWANASKTKDYATGELANQAISAGISK